VPWWWGTVVWVNGAWLSDPHANDATPSVTFGSSVVGALNQNRIVHLVGPCLLSHSAEFLASGRSRAVAGGLYVIFQGVTVGGADVAVIRCGDKLHRPQKVGCTWLLLPIHSVSPLPLFRRDKPAGP